MLFILVTSLVFLFVYSWFVEPRQLKFTRYKIRTAEEVTARIVLLTDLHLGKYSNVKSLLHTVELLRQYLATQPADILLLGGDYLDYQAKYVTDLAQILAALKTLGLPMYGVLGNHDYVSCKPIEPLLTVLETYGCIILRNSTTVVNLRGQQLLLIGVDDLEEAPDYHHGWRYISDTTYRNRVKALDWYSRFNLTAPQLPRILLSHNPDGVYLPGLAPVVVLAGHTHGGQLALVDFLGRFANWVVQLVLPAGSLRTKAGRLKLNDRNLVISRGIGGSAIPARFLRPPEIVIIELN